MIGDVGKLGAVEGSHQGKAGKDLCVSVPFEHQTVQRIQGLPRHCLGAELPGHDEFTVHDREQPPSQEQ